MRSCEHADKECPDCYRTRIRSIGVVGHRVDDTGRFRRDAIKANESELAAYRAARAEGIQPNGTRRADIDAARAFSDEHGTPWRGDNTTDTFERADLATSRPLTGDEKREIRERIAHGSKK